MKQPEVSTPPYDAVIVLGGGIVKDGERFVSTTYADSDPFGMLGGRMRIIAAAVLAKRQAANTFVFTTGVSAKTIEMFGAEAPSEADIYAKEFATQLGAISTKPNVVLEDRSQNTKGNMQESLDIVRTHSWRRIAYLSSRYHLPRSEALVSIVDPEISNQVDITYLSAEEIVREHLPGVYDQEINAAYASDAGLLRIQNEHAGLQAIFGGAYTPGEFQLR
jgi:uncharacterized SAM-binding protein YcdF (DUF218 family)